MVGWKVRALGCAWTAVLFLSLGCSTRGKPVQSPRPDLIEECQRVGLSSRNHVHILVINGFDPTEVTNANGLAHFLETAGFPNVYYTSQWKAWEYEERIRDIKQADASAKVAFVCYSMGVCYGRELAVKLKEDGSPVDLLIYLDVFAFNHSPEHSPDDGKRIVNIITEPRLGIFGSEPLPGAANYQFLGVRHVKVPSNARIIERVLEELIALSKAS
ncbi:hypothetical protein BH10PLA2_BH10PLA2_33860 [soil metagenome]